MKNGSGLHCDWIAVDWGTSHCRAWAMASDGRCLSEASNAYGMSRLAPEEFQSALLGLIEGWLGGDGTLVLACGMVGAQTGWVDAGYRGVPCAPRGDQPLKISGTDRRIDVRVLPGLRQDDPANVMRGEETQIAGFLSRTPDFDGVICLPGTHSKWAQISAGEVVSFQTAMTGELFSALTGATILRQTIPDEGWDEDAFSQAVSDAMSRPQALALRLFSLRAEALLKGLDGAAARARLSGLLIGIELAATRPYWLGQDVALIGAPALSAAYAEALGAQGLAPQAADATEMTLAGLTAARNGLKEVS